MVNPDWMAKLKP